MGSRRRASGSSTTRPAPRHSTHGCSIRRPEPEQVGHVWVRTNSPKTLRVTCWSRPEPSHVAHVVIALPGSAPSPSQRVHVTATSYGTSRVTPWAASTRSISTVAPRSAPCARRLLRLDRRRERRRRRRPRRDRRDCRSRRVPSGSRRSAAPRGRSGRRGRASRVFDSTSYASTTSRNRSCASGASETSG